MGFSHCNLNIWNIYTEYALYPNKKLIKIKNLRKEIMQFKKLLLMPKLVSKTKSQKMREKEETV